MIRRKRFIFAGGISVLLAVGLFFLANIAVQVHTSERLLQFEEVGVITILATVLALVVYFWWRLSRSLRHIRDQLGQFENDNRIGMIMIDKDDGLAELVAGINRHLTRVKTQLEDKRIQKRELKLQARVAETERQQIEAIIHSLSEAARLKDEFFTDVSHELKTPLASICAYAEMLTEQSQPLEADYQGFGKIIKEQGIRLSHLVDDILDVSRIESGTLEPNCQTYNLAETIDEVMATMHPQAQEKQITLSCELPDEGLRVNADRKMMYHALVNLLSNAMKYSPVGREVKLLGRVDCTSETVVIDVMDQGIGIPEECCERIFEKFYRVEQNKNFANGSGLGLNLVKRIVEDFHDGTITVVSRVGQGSRFRMTIPMCEVKPLSYS